MASRTEGSNLANFGDCHPAFPGTNAPRNDRAHGYGHVIASGAKQSRFGDWLPAERGISLLAIEDDNPTPLLIEESRKCLRGTC